MSIWGAFIASWMEIFGYPSATYANSCSNVNVIGTYDESGLRVSESGIYAAGTFRIADEADEETNSLCLTSLRSIVKSNSMTRATQASNVTSRRLLYGLSQVSRTQTIQIVRSLSTLRRIQ
jgi:hypothetical protein